MSNSTEKQNVPQRKASAKDTVLWVGIDWADQKHCVATRRPDGSDSKLHWVDQKPQKLDEFFLELQKQHLTGHIGVVLEQSRGALLYALLKYSFLELYPINPRCLADFRKAMAASGAKGDPSDADLLCELGCKHGERLRALELEDEATRQLELLNEHRRGIVDEQTGLSNQLGSALKCYYPLILELFADHLVAPIALDFLERWPNLAALQKAKPGVLRAFFHKHNGRSEEKIQERIKAIGEAKPLTNDAVVIACYQLQVQTLIERLRAVQAGIAQYDERIKVVFASHAKARVFSSFPAAGPVLAPRLASGRLWHFGSQLPSARRDALLVGGGPHPNPEREEQSRSLSVGPAEVPASDLRRVCAHLGALLPLGTGVLQVSHGERLGQVPHLPSAGL